MREKLPFRHESPAVIFPHGGAEYRVGVGLRESGECAEIFLNGISAREGSDAQAMLGDLATMASLLMQTGWKAWDLARRLSVDGLARTALNHAADIQKEMGE